MYNEVMRRRRKVGRLGSWESESQLHGLYRGQYLGQMDPGGTTGGGVQPLQAELEAQDRSPLDNQIDAIRSEYTTSLLRGGSGAANIARIPRSFLQLHPGLRRYLR